MDLKTLSGESGGRKLARRSVMIYLGDSEVAYRCPCGANVFTMRGPLRYVCNGCGTDYRGEK